MALTLIISLIVAGIILILLEILVTPGFIVGLIGVAFLGLAIALTYKNYGSTSGNIMVLVTALAVVGSLLLAFKSGIWNKFTLKETIDGRASTLTGKTFAIGDQGETISALRPSGNAIVNGQKIEVSSEGEAIESQQKIEVIKIINNKIIVKQTA